MSVHSGSDSYGISDTVMHVTGIPLDVGSEQRFECVDVTPEVGPYLW